MSSDYTASNKIEKPSSGDQNGSWDVTLRSNWDLQDEAMDGYVTQAITTADVTLTMDVTSCVARNRVIELTGASTASRNLIVPAIEKTWIIFNNTTGGYAHTVKVSGQTGVSVPNGKTMVLYCNGTDVKEGQNYSAGALPLTGGTMTGTAVFTAGTTTVAPYKFQAGTTLTTPVAHTVEWDGTSLYVTNSSASRKTVAYTDSNITGSAATLTTTRSISCTGDATWTVNFNGSANATAALTLANTAVTAGTYTNATITVDAKGRLTAASSGSGGSSGVTTFNTRSGAVTLSSSDVTTALGYTPASTAGPTFTGTLTAVNLTTTGNTTLGDTSGDTLTVNATSTFVNTATFNGPVNLGNASGDTITAVGNADFQNNVTLGSSSADSVTVNGTMAFSTQPTGLTGLPIASGRCNVSGGAIASGPTNNCSVTYNATGKYTVTFDTPTADSDYIVVLGVNRVAADTAVDVINYHSPTTSGFQIKVETTGAASHDPVSFSFVVFT